MDGSDEIAKQKDLERSKKHLSNLREEEKKMKIPQDQAKLKAALEFLRDECWLVETAPLWEKVSDEIFWDLILFFWRLVEWGTIVMLGSRVKIYYIDQCFCKSMKENYLCRSTSRQLGGVKLKVDLGEFLYYRPTWRALPPSACP